MMIARVTKIMGRKCACVCLYGFRQAVKLQSNKSLSTNSQDQQPQFLDDMYSQEMQDLMQVYHKQEKKTDAICA